MAFGTAQNRFLGDVSSLDVLQVVDSLFYGNVWFADATNGSATGDGKSWSTAFSTIALAVAAASAGDRIYIRGSFTEAVSIAVAGVRIIGADPSPQQAIWAGAADAKCLTITASGIHLENIRFRAPARTSGTPAAVYLSTGATYVRIKNCRFQGTTGAYYGIYTLGDCDNGVIEDSEFCYFNTATYGTAIKSTGASETTGFEIKNCKFRSNLNHIVFPMKEGVIRGNLLPAGGYAAAGTYSTTLTVLGIDVHGLASTVGYNQITQNHLGSLYHQACYYGATGDEWDGNFCTDRTHSTQVDATTGLSILAPAA